MFPERFSAAYLTAFSHGIGQGRYFHLQPVPEADPLYFTITAGMGELLLQGEDIPAVAGDVLKIRAHKAGKQEGAFRVLSPDAFVEDKEAVV